MAALAVTGDEAAFRELVLRRQARVRALLFRLCGDRDRADDLAQQTFLTAWRSIRSLRAVGALGGWLRQVAVNTWLQEVRKGRLAEDDVFDAVVETTADPMEHPDRAGQRLDLERALARLNPRERLCVVLSFAEGLSHGEIAETTGIALGTVKSHVTRGGEKLRGWLKVGEP